MAQQYEQQDNDGAAFPVESKTEDWHDDYSGKIMVEGSMYWLGVRDMKSKAGKPYLKLKVRPVNSGASQSQGGDLPF